MPEIPETPTITDEIMQAAERLRRCQTESRDGVYFWLGGPSVGMLNDRNTLAEFALSILPKGERPVPMAQGPGASGYVWWDSQPRFASWDDEFDGGCLMVHVGGSRYGTTTVTLFATEQEAIDHQWLQALAARSAS